MQTVCTYWLKGLCMKGNECGFLHEFDPARMPLCRNLIKWGECRDTDCPFKHSQDHLKVRTLLACCVMSLKSSSVRILQQDP